MSEVREYTGTTPVKVGMDNTQFIDWSLTGRGAGVGLINNNLLDLSQQVSVPNGHPESSPYYGQVITSPNNRLPYIPNNRDPQQWLSMTCTVEVSAPGQIRLGVDDRSPIYEHAQYKITLPAGNYKFIFEAYDFNLVNKWRSARLTRNSSIGGYWGDPFWALVDINNNQLAFDKIEKNQYSDINWLHIEYPFQLSGTTDLGVMCLSLLFYARFQIVKADVEAEPFTAQYGSYTFTGDTCWDAYGAHIPLSIYSSAGDSRDYDFYVPHKLVANESISYTSTGQALTGYIGDTTIAVNTEVSPMLYIKYTGDPPNFYSVERPEQINVYDVNEPQDGFDHNGVAILMPYEVISQKEDKGRWDVTLKHPIDPYGKWTYIVGQNVLKIRGQLFRIDQTEIIADTNKEYISAHANHITYDLKDYWITDAQFTVEDGNSYITQLWTHRITEFPNQQPTIGDYSFSVTSDLTGHIDASLKDQSFIEALFGADNSMMSRYGGELYRDNFTISINQTMEHAPSGNAFSLRYGTNLTKISFKIDYSDWVTNLVCVDNIGDFWAIWYGGIYLPHHHKTKRLHFTYDLSDPSEGIDRLIADGSAYWYTVNTPQISIEIGVANIKNDPKYADFLNLQNFDVGYKGIIYVEHLGINVEMKIAAIKRDELTGEAIQIKLGSTRGSLIRSTVMSQTIVSPNSVEGKNVDNNNVLQDELFDMHTRLMSTNLSMMQGYTINEISQRTISELEGT